MVCKAFLEVHKEVHVEVLGIMPVIATLWTNLIVGISCQMFCVVSMFY